MSGYWRRRAIPIIRDTIIRYGTDDIKLLRKKLREAYPFGERKYWPYKVWLDEINTQLGLKPPKPPRSTYQKEQLDPNQMSLFGDGL